MTDSTDWQSAAQAYANRVGAAEYEQQVKAHLKARRSRLSFRFAPSDYLRGLCADLGRNDEESFKARKMNEGRGSAAGV